MGSFLKAHEGNENSLFPSIVALLFLKRAHYCYIIIIMIMIMIIIIVIIVMKLL